LQSQKKSAEVDKSNGGSTWSALSNLFFLKKTEDFQHPASQGIFVYIIAQISYKVGGFSVKLHFQNL
jgi:hypothetical protein